MKRTPIGRTELLRVPNSGGTAVRAATATLAVVFAQGSNFGAIVPAYDLQRHDRARRLPLAPLIRMAVGGAFD